MNQGSSKYIANHIKELPRSGIRDFFAIVSQVPDAISLGIGEPDFISPWHVREAAIFALEQGKTSYTDNLGLIELRIAIVKYLESNFGITYNPHDEVLVTTGVSEALDVTLRAIINPGDKILYHEPSYVSYHPSVTLAHGEAISVPTCSKNNFKLEPKSLINAWQPGCKALLLNFPTNPTGGTIDHEKLVEIARFVVDKDLLVISDEIYAELTFEGKHRSIASLPGMKNRTVLLHGVSKAFAMTGFRLGYVCATPALIEAMTKVHQYSMMCAPILSQTAAIEALNNGGDSVQRMFEQYLRRREYMVRRFNEIGLPCYYPEGTFYTFPNVQSTGLTEIEFSHRLLRDQKVAVVPGTAFGEKGKGHIRTSFSSSYEHIIEATDRIEQFVGNL